jgi:GTP-binding protein
LISSPIKEKLYRVAILGRPNVGKSTLFNRLIGVRKAITDPTPGVTRDAVESEWQLGNSRVLLVDTGGFNLQSGDMETRISERSLRMADEADLLLLVIDANGISGEDLDFMERLRKHEQKLILVANKVDTAKHEDAVWNFYELGFNTLIGVSAAHGRNIDSLRDIIRRRSLEKPLPGRGAGDSEGARTTINLAVIGKPNTGKSTLLNTLLDEEKSLVTDIPGTTRDTIEGKFGYKGFTFRVLDTAGIRRKNRVNDAVEYYSVNRAISSLSEADIVLLLIDAREGVTDQDKKIASLAVSKGRGVILCLNKWDLMPKLGNSFEAARDRLRFLFAILDFAPVLPISALKGEGVSKLLATTLQVWRQLNRRVDTPRLNKALAGWLEHYGLPVRGKNIKLRYATQIGINPVRFVFFVNRLRGFPNRYKNYLTNKIREDLGFGSIPIQLEIREKRS